MLSKGTYGLLLSASARILPTFLPASYLHREHTLLAFLPATCPLSCRHFARTLFTFLPIPCPHTAHILACTLPAHCSHFCPHPVRILPTFLPYCTLPASCPHSWPHFACSGPHAMLSTTSIGPVHYFPLFPFFSLSPLSISFFPFLSFLFFYPRVPSKVVWCPGAMLPCSRTFWYPGVRRG